MGSIVFPSMLKAITWHISNKARIWTYIFLTPETKVFHLRCFFESVILTPEVPNGSLGKNTQKLYLRVPWQTNNPQSMLLQTESTIFPSSKENVHVFYLPSSVSFLVSLTLPSRSRDDSSISLTLPIGSIENCLLSCSAPPSAQFTWQLGRKEYQLSFKQKSQKL
jgi:hypothetical protein